MDVFWSYEYNISTILQGSVLGNAVGVSQAWNVSVPSPLTTEEKKNMSEIITRFLFCFFHLTSEEVFILTVRLSASEARKDSALILELMLG